MGKLKLRKYQNDCVNKINEMGDGKKIAFLATGAGKTIIMSYLASKIKGRVLICVDQAELREQTIDKLSIFIPKKEIGSVQGSRDEVDKRIVVATRQSLTHSKSTRLDRMIQSGEFELLLVDETHRAVKQVATIIDRVGAKKVIGFTATPYNRDLSNVYDGFVYEKDILSLVEEGYLCSPRALSVHTNTSLDGVQTLAGEFNQKQLDEVVNVKNRNKLIVKKYIELASDRKKTLCFCTSIEHAEELAREFNKAGVCAKNVDSSLNSRDRMEVLSDFKNGKIKVLTNIGVLTTGFDEPSVDCIVMARPTKSKILFTQCVGRGLRTFEGKNDCLVLDIADLTTKARMNLMSCKSVFDLQDDENLKERKERIALEAEENERKERERKERELLEAELVQREINLFNSNLENIRNISNLHWFFNNIKGTDIAILSAEIGVDYYIFNNNIEFVAYKRIQKGSELIEIATSDNLAELTFEVEKLAVKKGSSFISKSAAWKYEDATEKQKMYCKTNVKTKWDCHRYFSKRNCYFSLKNIIRGVKK